MADVKDFAKRIAPHVIGCPSMLVERVARDVIIDFCQRTHILSMVFDHSVAAADVDDDFNHAVDIEIPDVTSGTKAIGYRTSNDSSGRPVKDSEGVLVLSPITDIEHLQLIDITGLWIDGSPKRVERLSLATDMAYRDNILGSVVYCHILEPHVMRIFPLEAEAQTLTIKAAFEPVENAYTYPQQLYDHHSRTIEWGTVADLMDMPGKVWSNHQLAQIFRARYSRQLSSVLAQLATTYSGPTIAAGGFFA